LEPRQGVKILAARRAKGRAAGKAQRNEDHFAAVQKAARREKPSGMKTILCAHGAFVSGLRPIRTGKGTPMGAKDAGVAPAVRAKDAGDVPQGRLCKGVLTKTDAQKTERHFFSRPPCNRASACWRSVPAWEGLDPLT